MASEDTYKITYFPAAGRAESARLSLLLGGKTWEDEVITFKQWGEHKPTTVWGSMPYLTLNGETVLGQCRAFTRYCAKVGGVYPESDVEAAHVDAIYDVVEDILSACLATKDTAERGRIATEGKGRALLLRLNDFVASVGSDGFAVGNSITLADLVITVYITNLGSGFFDGITPEMFVDGLDNLQNIRRKTFNNDVIKAHYRAMEGQEGPYKNWVPWTDLE